MAHFSVFVFICGVSLASAQSPPDPWAMTRKEWRASLHKNFESLLVCDSKHKKDLAWKKSQSEEIKAINEFASLFKDPVAAYREGVLNSGENPELLEADRDEKFAKKLNGGEFSCPPLSSITGAQNRLEDARVSIMIGRKLGYREKDILFYLVRNHIIATFMQKDFWSRLNAHPEESQADKTQEKLWKSLVIPAPVKAQFPFFKSTNTFF